jgi:hypothetical protein
MVTDYKNHVHLVVDTDYYNLFTGNYDYMIYYFEIDTIGDRIMISEEVISHSEGMLPVVDIGWFNEVVVVWKDDSLSTSPLKLRKNIELYFW